MTVTVAPQTWAVKPGDIDRFVGRYFYLGNYLQHPVEYAGVVYPSNEHAFAAAKTLDSDIREKIRVASLPPAAKSIGRAVRLRPGWDEIKNDVMATLVARKFTNPKLRDLLLGTGDAVLVEGNSHYDDVWGAVQRDGRWVGENRLGRILMVTRRRLRVEWENADV